MFKTASFFRISDNFILPSPESLEEALQAAQFLPCGATQPESSGWVAPRGKDSVALSERIGPHVLLQLCTERRPLPSSAVKAAMEERIDKYKQETGRERVGAKVKKEMKEEVILRSEERRVGKECRSLWLPYPSTKKRSDECQEHELCSYSVTRKLSPTREHMRRISVSRQ